jgi:hypothetical protein
MRLIHLQFRLKDKKLQCVLQKVCRGCSPSLKEMITNSTLKKLINATVCTNVSAAENARTSTDFEHNCHVDNLDSKKKKINITVRVFDSTQNISQFSLLKENLDTWFDLRKKFNIARLFKWNSKSTDKDLCS